MDYLEGTWLEIKIGRRPDGPSITKLDATNSYAGQPEQFYLLNFELLSWTEAGRLGLTNSEESTPEAIWDNGYGLTSSYNNVGSAKNRVRVLDVGHASCAAIHDNPEKSNRVIGYYDVGAPVYFHLKDFPKVFKEHVRVPNDGEGFVALSHWDFDHYSLAVTKLPQLRTLKWYAPFQAVGKNCLRLQKLVGGNLTFISAATYGILPDVLLFRGTASYSDRNNSGYAARVGTMNEAYLLAGDVGYLHLSPFATMNLLGLGITHHGGRGADHPPPPLAKNLKAVVSYGAKNTYGHPKIDSLLEHANAGWKIIETAQPKRGDRWL
ncbi:MULTISPECIES: hypothetical protein [unclassified Herbaspirillum]|nr:MULTISPECIES: hypothetical protein [unclassified Herbaspirillum]